MATPDRQRLSVLKEDNRRILIPDPVFISGYADASFKHDSPHKGGGWGIWVRDSSTRILRSGVCPDWVTEAYQAETCATWAAIHTALTHLDAQNSNILVVKTDNQQVARYFGWSKSLSIPLEANVARVLLMAYEMALDKEIKLVVTWVKGHQRQSKGNTPGFLNHRVDRMAWDARTTRKGIKKMIPLLSRKD